MIYRQKLDSSAYISAAKSIGASSTTFTQSVQKATEFGEITQPLGLLPVVKVRVNAGHCVPPPPIFSLCSSPTWIQMLSVNYMLKSQWATVNMLLVDFTAECQVNVMAAWHPRLTYRHTDTRTISLTIIYTVCQKVGHLTMAITLSVLDLRSVHNKNWHTVGKILNAISAFHMSGSRSCLWGASPLSPPSPFLSLFFPFPSPPSPLLFFPFPPLLP